MIVQSTKCKTRRQHESGQALVLVLLALAVVLTIVLFILSRSITDLSVSSSQSQSVSAFSAAEAGVEQALVVGTGSSSTVGSGSYSSQVTGVGQNLSSFVYPVELNSGDSMTLWLKSQDASSDFSGNTVKICWGKPGTSNSSATTPAIETVLFYETSAGDPGTAKIFRLTADPYSGRNPANSFSSAGGACTVAGQSFEFQTTLDLTGLVNPQFAFIRMFYNTDTTQPVAFDSTDSSKTFPTQGILVDSSGSAGGTADAPQSTRKVEVFQSWPEIPNVFQFAVYGSTGLTK